MIVHTKLSVVGICRDEHFNETLLAFLRIYLVFNDFFMFFMVPGLNIKNKLSLLRYFQS